jgi:hypothetical protein
MVVSPLYLRFFFYISFKRRHLVGRTWCALVGHMISFSLLLLTSLGLLLILQSGDVSYVLSKAIFFAFERTEALHSYQTREHFSYKGTACCFCLGIRDKPATWIKSELLKTLFRYISLQDLHTYDVSLTTCSTAHEQTKI